MRAPVRDLRVAICATRSTAYQPLVDGAKAGSRGRVLARWKHPELATSRADSTTGESSGQISRSALGAAPRLQEAATGALSTSRRVSRSRFASSCASVLRLQVASALQARELRRRCSSSNQRDRVIENFDQAIGTLKRCAPTACASASRLRHGRHRELHQAPPNDKLKIASASAETRLTTRATPRSSRRSSTWPQLALEVVARGGSAAHATARGDGWDGCRVPVPAS